MIYPKSAKERNGGFCAYLVDAMHNKQVRKSDLLIGFVRAWSLGYKNNLPCDPTQEIKNFCEEFKKKGLSCKDPELKKYIDTHG